MSENKPYTGAVRSTDANELDFTALPMIGLIGVARTAKEGTTRYGRYNYMRGFSCHDLLNHAIRHIVMDIAGDRSEPNLEHAAWGLLAAIQSRVLTPELSEPYTLGPGATITEPMRKHMESLDASLKAYRDKVKADRANGIPDPNQEWSIMDLSEIKTIINARMADGEIGVIPAREPHDIQWSHVDDEGFTVIAPKHDPSSELETSAQKFAEPLTASLQPTKRWSDIPVADMPDMVNLTREGKTRSVPLRIVIDGRPVINPSPGWEEVLFVSRAEDEYALMSSDFLHKAVLVVDRKFWDHAPNVTPSPYDYPKTI